MSQVLGSLPWLASLRQARFLVEGLAGFFKPPDGLDGLDGLVGVNNLLQFFYGFFVSAGFNCPKICLRFR